MLIYDVLLIDKKNRQERNSGHTSTTPRNQNKIYVLQDTRDPAFEEIK